VNSITRLLFAVIVDFFWRRGGFVTFGMEYGDEGMLVTEMTVSLNRDENNGFVDGTFRGFRCRVSVADDNGEKATYPSSNRKLQFRNIDKSMTQLQTLYILECLILSLRNRFLPISCVIRILGR
jgi:hypothetical protein